MPKRIQRKRTKGWRAPLNAINCCRPGKHGNPFRVGGWFKIGIPFTHGMTMVWCERCIWKDADHDTARREGFTYIGNNAQAVEMFRKYRRRFPLNKADMDELRGQDLMCWCAPYDACHADVLLELANKEIS